MNNRSFAAAFAAAVIAISPAALAEGLTVEEPPEDGLVWSAPIAARSVSELIVTGFGDVSESDWFYDDVAYITRARLMEGYDSETFAPYDNATEGMMMTVLYRMAGSPAVSDAGAEWYAPAVKWGRLNGIIDTGDWAFEPETNITRGAFAYMLAAYNERVEGGNSSGDAGLFPDSADFPGYAESAAGWAGERGIVTGRDGGEFDFYGEATRAELAAMLHRYIAAGK